MIIIKAFVAILVCTTDALPRTVFISDALMTNLVWATDKILRAASLFGAGPFTDTLSFVGAGYLAVEFCIEEEFPGAVFIIDALVTFLVSTTNELPRTVFVIGALVAVLV